VRFPAGPFTLEGELAYPVTEAPAGAVVLAGPHPLLGGTMHNNVVRRLGDGLAGQGLVTLRFDYHGHGDLARQMAEFWLHSTVKGEERHEDDLLGAVAFLRSVVPEAPLALAGYSFGCTLLPAAARAHPVSALVLVAPTVGKH